ncbi:DUF4062 domain-containing protein [Nocardioides sp. CN2-186]|uniref:DUF4062 domain-containing protein n=1 Tax=Nocardioides tweenelious TaxID=3156607 RepID=UPI0032B5D705
MRVFISSVRRGLEQERDALPGLLKAVGFEPVRFEDFTAQQVPSRQACLDGVDSADAYLLLIGPHYGHVFPETGQSATHDEYVRARTRGIPRLVFTKAGVDMDDDQKAFVDEIGDYGAGSFWATFDDVTDLQTKVAAALREVASQPGHLTYHALGELPDVTWRSDWDDPRVHQQGPATIELHVLPLGTDPIPLRVMRTMTDRLVTALRSSGSLPIHAGVEPRSDDQSATVELPPPARRGPIDVLRPSHVMGARVESSGQVSVWWALPTDGMGGVLNAADLTSNVAASLRLAGLVGVGAARRLAVAAGVEGSMISVVDGPLGQTGRSRANFGFGGDEPVRVLPDESVSPAALDRGADELARDLAAALLEKFGRRR